MDPKRLKAGDPNDAIEAALLGDGAEGALREDLFYRLNERQGTSKRLSDPALRRLQELPEPDPGKVLSVAPDSTVHVRVGSSIAEVERRLVLATLEQPDGDKQRASELLGISLKTLYNRLNVYQAAESNS